MPCQVFSPTGRFFFSFPASSRAIETSVAPGDTRDKKISAGSSPGSDRRVTILPTERQTIRAGGRPGCPLDSRWPEAPSMSLRYLYGPVEGALAADCLPRATAAGDCLPFDHQALDRAGSWDALAASWPDGWRPDFVALHLSYRSVPAWLWG